MIKTYCDMCEKEIEPYDIFTVNIEPKELFSDEYKTREFQVCMKCRKKLINYIRYGAKGSC